MGIFTGPSIIILLIRSLEESYMTELGAECRIPRSGDYEKMDDLPAGWARIQ